MTNEIVIRRFKESDLNEVHINIMLAFETELLSKVYEPRAFEIWNSMYTPKCILGYSKLRHMYVAVYNKKIAGCGAVSKDGSMAYISCVYINNHYQGLGIGKALISALEKDEISVSTGKVYLDAMLTAKRFYEKLGYHIDGDFPEIIYHEGIEAIQLVKELG